MGNEDTRRGSRSNEHTLPPGTYIYVQDGTSGKIKTYVGPTVVTLTGNDSPIVFEMVKGMAEFRRCDTLQEAVRKSIVAPDGFYAVLMNPAKGGVHPIDGEVKPAPDLEVGNKVVVTGPRMFALWPGQSAKVVRGHHLRSNQYLLCRVYNEDEARKNWAKAKMVKAVTSPTDSTGAQGGDPTQQQPPEPTTAQVPEKLTIGQLLIIRGTEVSFYIPPTGITVVPEEDGEYVREAITLEQLQYCILLDENGHKRYVHGPAVVFPEPTETFVKDGEGNAVFRAVELNEIQGIHLKITRSYKDDVLGELKEGQEVFITGKQYPIYFPREEHAIVKYDGKTKHFAVAIPEGEARYVMNRLSGEVKLVTGPRMLLANPVTEVIVRRALTEKECRLWYPGNAEVLAYNQALNEVARAAPTTRAGAVSEGDFERAAKRRGMEGLSPGQSSSDMTMYSSSQLTSRGMAKKSLMDVSGVSNALAQTMGDEISRASTFTQPRTVTLNTKFEGAPRISVWTGFAIMIVNSKGERRVVEGPANVLLAYDETLEYMSLSTGKPKTTDNLISTPYLRTKNNKVADIVQVETADHVLIDIKLSYLVNFTGDSKKWWDVENYVKFLCDHMRSKLKGMAKQLGVEDLYSNPLNFVRMTVLMSVEKPGDPDPRLFVENGMMVADVEVLSTKIADDSVARVLTDSQRAAVQRSITLADMRRNLEATKERERIAAEEAETKFATESKKRELEKRTLAEKLTIRMAEIVGAIEEATNRARLRQTEEELVAIGHEAGLERSKATFELEHAQAVERQKLELAEMAAEADALVKRFSALSGGLSEALLTLSSQRTLADVAQALSVQKLLGGQNAVDVLGKMFDGTPLGALMDKIAEKAGTLPNGNGDHKKLGAVEATS